MGVNNYGILVYPLGRIITNENKVTFGELPSSGAKKIKSLARYIRDRGFIAGSPSGMYYKKGLEHKTINFLGKTKKYDLVLTSKSSSNPKGFIKETLDNLEKVFSSFGFNYTIEENRISINGINDFVIDAVISNIKDLNLDKEVSISKIEQELTSVRRNFLINLPSTLHQGLEEELDRISEEVDLCQPLLNHKGISSLGSQYEVQVGFSLDGTVLDIKPNTYNSGNVLYEVLDITLPSACIFSVGIASNLIKGSKGNKELIPNPMFFDFRPPMSGAIPVHADTAIVTLFKIGQEVQEPISDPAVLSKITSLSLAAAVDTYTGRKTNIKSQKIPKVKVKIDADLEQDTTTNVDECSNTCSNAYSNTSAEKVEDNQEEHNQIKYKRPVRVIEL